VLAKPTVGVELIVAPVHLKYFGTIEKIAEAKADVRRQLVFPLNDN
jgi:UDP-N-acetylmuramyl pentapeptide synthase